MKSTPSAKITCLWLDSDKNWSENFKKNDSMDYKYSCDIPIKFHFLPAFNSLRAVERPNINPNARNNFWITGVWIIEKWQDHAHLNLVSFYRLQTHLLLNFQVVIWSEETACFSISDIPFLLCLFKIISALLKCVICTAEFQTWALNGPNEDF